MIFRSNRMAIAWSAFLCLGPNLQIAQVRHSVFMVFSFAALHSAGIASCGVLLHNFMFHCCSIRCALCTIIDDFTN